MYEMGGAFSAMSRAVRCSRHELHRLRQKSPHLSLHALNGEIWFFPLPRTHQDQSEKWSRREGRGLSGPRECATKSLEQVDAVIHACHLPCSQTFISRTARLSGISRRSGLCGHTIRCGSSARDLQRQRSKLVADSATKVLDANTHYNCEAIDAGPRRN